MSILQCVVPGNIRTPGRLLEIPRGRGVLKAKFLEAMYENKLEFPGERGSAKQKTFCGGSMEIFWNCAMFIDTEADPCGVSGNVILKKILKMYGL